MTARPVQQGKLIQLIDSVNTEIHRGTRAASTASDTSSTVDVRAVQGCPLANLLRACHWLNSSILATAIDDFADASCLELEETSYRST